MGWVTAVQFWVFFVLGGEFCYVLNSRQMGKSSLMVRTRHRLQEEGFKCATVDMTNIGIDDFFAFIRFCYNQRAIEPEYNRITFVICGVTTPSDLIQAPKRTPFNIAKSIELHGFTLDEVQPLAQGLVEARGGARQSSFQGNAQLILKEILAWTGGQPFVTQKLCYLVVHSIQGIESETLTIPPGTEAYWVESIVTHIIDKWESQDEPEHLRTIRDRLVSNERSSGRNLGIYQQILAGKDVPANYSREHIELILSGLVVNKQGYLKLKNPIYQAVFNCEWVAKQLDNLRPYAQSFNAWITSNSQDESQLLVGMALQEALAWSKDFRTSGGCCALWCKEYPQQRCGQYRICLLPNSWLSSIGSSRDLISPKLKHYVKRNYLCYTHKIYLLFASCLIKPHWTFS